MNSLRALLVLAGALAVTGAASAAFPGTYALQSPAGVVVAGVRISAVQLGSDTRLLATNARTGTLLHARTLSGSFGVPTLIPANTPLGVFRGGRRLVLQSSDSGRTTRFLVVRPANLSVAQTITLRGSFAFDALSPSGTRLYLIQHTSGDLEHYVVRGYDLSTGRLLPGRIADRTQANWVMRGWPDTRVVSRTGRWVYTLYSNPGGFPFVHALDTVAGVAHCVGFAWHGSQNALTGYRLELRGNRLLVLRGNGTVYRSIDRTTWAVWKT